MAKKRSGVMSIPLDLMLEILKKLPTKSLVRCLCVSYQWQSIINNFIVIHDSIVTRCLTQPPPDPHFIFDKCSSSQSSSIFSYAHPYHQITNEEQHYHEEIFGKSTGDVKNFQYVRGLIGFWCSDFQFTIHNPTTKQSLPLPITPFPVSWLFYLFGYDPFKHQYKVLCLTRPDKLKLSCKVFMLGDPSEKWWDIEYNIVRHFPFGQAVCIKGAIYYKAWIEVELGPVCLVSFDIRSEKFTLIHAPENLLNDHKDLTLVNNQGKLGCICRNKLNENDVDFWVMVNAEKQEWSKITYLSVLQDLPYLIKFAGVTHPGGEIVIVHLKDLKHSELPSEVHCYDPKRNSRRRVEVQTSDVVDIWAVTDHVENIMRL